MNKIFNEDCEIGMKNLQDNSINLVITSPPYADMRKYPDFKGIHPSRYVDWFLPKAEQIKRIICEDGSFVLNINDKIVNGFRSTYVFRLVIAIEDIGLNLYEKFFWYKVNPMPGMGGKRVKDGIEYIFHFSKNKPKIFMENVKYPSIDKRNRQNAKYGISRSGHKTEKRETSIRFPELCVPSNVLNIPLGAVRKNAGNHIAIFPYQIPEFFIKFTTQENDVVLDPFLGSGTTAIVAKKLNRKYIGYEISKEYYENACKNLDNVVK